MNHVFIGIDPGVQGAIAMICVDPKFDRVADTPTFKVGKSRLDYDIEGMRHQLHTMKQSAGEDAQVFVFIETPIAMPKQSSSSTLKTGMGYGFWVGLVVGELLPYEPVSPGTWKKVMFAGMGNDMKRSKDASLFKAKQEFPHMAEFMERKKDHDRAEALLIAQYGRDRHWSHYTGGR